LPGGLGIGLADALPRAVEKFLVSRHGDSWEADSILTDSLGGMAV
jgi:hypothetical protein